MNVRNPHACLVKFWFNAIAFRGNVYLALEAVPGLADATPYGRSVCGAKSGAVI